MTTAAIILSAGRGKRMGTDTPKQYLEINGRPLLHYSIKAFEDSDVSSIIIVAGESDIDYVRDKIVIPGGFSKVSSIVAGGDERYDSVYCGLTEATGYGTIDYVMIHDGARPYVSRDIIDRCMTTVINRRACIAAMPVKDTIKEIDENGVIVSTPARESLYMAQTPQCFEFELCYDSYKKMIDCGDTKGITDDAMVVEKFGNVRSVVVWGSYDNIKITTPSDLRFELPDACIS